MCKAGYPVSAEISFKSEEPVLRTKRYDGRRDNTVINEATQRNNSILRCLDNACRLLTRPKAGSALQGEPGDTMTRFIRHQAEAAKIDCRSLSI